MKPRFSVYPEGEKKSDKFLQPGLFSEETSAPRAGSAEEPVGWPCLRLAASVASSPMVEQGGWHFAQVLWPLTAQQVGLQPTLQSHSPCWPAGSARLAGLPWLLPHQAHTPPLCSAISSTHQWEGGPCRCSETTVSKEASPYDRAKSSLRAQLSTL